MTKQNKTKKQAIQISQYALHPLSSTHMVPIDRVTIGECGTRCTNTQLPRNEQWIRRARSEPFP